MFTVFFEKAYINVRNTFVTIICALHPNSNTLPHSSSKRSLVIGAISPVVLTVAIRFPIFVVTLVSVAIFKLFDASPVFEEALELSFIPAPSVVPGMHPIAMNVACFPLSHIAVGNLIATS